MFGMTRVKWLHEHQFISIWGIYWVLMLQMFNWFTGFGSKLKDNFMYWKFQLWLFHVWVKVVQCILIPTLFYFLLLLPWTKKALLNMLQPIRFMLWWTGERMRVTWISWDHLATPKWLGGATILDLEMHLMALNRKVLRDIY